MRLPRFIAKIYAGLNGYFWLPCPRCGRMFGGFECVGDIVNENGCFGQATCCPDSVEDMRRNEARRQAYYERSEGFE